MTSRPRPPRLVSSYLAVFTRCSPPSVVRATIVSRSSLAALKPRSVSPAPSFIKSTPRPGPDR